MKPIYQFFLFFFCLFAILDAHSQVSEYAQTDLENAESRVYVQHRDLLVTNDGLYLKGENELIPLKSIAVDEFGMHVVTLGAESIRPYKKPECRNGHPIYHEKCGCANWLCPFRCKCYSPWALTHLSDEQL